MTELLPLEAAYLRAIKNRSRAIGKWDQKIQAIQSQIIPNCRHAEVVDFHWEHDNGYGHQSRNIGKRCVFCRKVNHYPTLTAQWVEIGY